MRCKSCNIKTVRRKLADFEFDAFICENDDDPHLYHITSVDGMKKILENGCIKTGPGDECAMSRFGAVSLSASPFNTYGKGLIKIVLRKDAMEGKVKPMMYYDYNGESGRMVGRIVNLHAQTRGMTPDEAASDLGLTSKSLIDECEWYSIVPIPVNKTTVDGIVFMIPEVIVEVQFDNNFLSCDNSGRQYAWSEVSMKKVVDYIGTVREIVKSRGIRFSVDSCFNKLVAHDVYDDRVYVLDRENLDRIANGEMPVEASKHAKNECKCD